MVEQACLVQLLGHCVEMAAVRWSSSVLGSVFDFRGSNANISVVEVPVAAIVGPKASLVAASPSCGLIPC